MERLTKREILGNAYFPKCFEEPCNGCGCQDDDCDMGEVCEKLASYEDTGLTPEQIIEIDKLFTEKCRELAEERKKHEWIPCSERLPEERESIFAKFKGTDKWRSAMFEKMSDNVNVTVEFEDGTRMSMKGYTVDGKWKPDTVVKCKVIAWRPLPESYNPERSNT